MPKFPPALRAAIALFPAYPGDFKLDDASERLSGRFSGPRYPVVLTVLVTPDCGLTARQLQTIIESSPVTPLLLSLIGTSKRHVDTALAPGAHSFLPARHVSKRAVDPALEISKPPAAVQIGMPFLPVIDLLQPAHADLRAPSPIA